MTEGSRFCGRIGVWKMANSTEKSSEEIDNIVQFPAGRVDPIGLHSRIINSNINPQTFLMTDYLNHFNEVVMLLDMVPDMPEIVEELIDWKPKSYAEHFHDSGLKDTELVIEAYEAAPTQFRAPFDQLVASMDAIIMDAIARSLQLAEAEKLDELCAVVVASTKIIYKIQDTLSGVINGTHPGLSQDEIDSLMDLL